MGRLTRGTVLALALASVAAVATRAGTEDDPRVRAFVAAYGALIDSVTYGEEDAVFYLGTSPIHFRDGRMLADGRLEGRDQCQPIFYAYPLGPMVKLPPPPPEELPTYCSDLLESLWGSTELEIREHGRSITFLDHRMFVNELLVDALTAVEREILAAAKSDSTVATWVDDITVTYSFMRREIAGSSTQSYHGWGMAVDLVPSSYDGRQVYWRWSRAFDREGWYRIPIEGRWSPPDSVIRAFERHGFVWGGKWTHFDGIHFEYRPEILAYNGLLRNGRPGGGPARTADPGRSQGP